MSFDVNRLPAGLAKAYSERRCAVFVGAGASQAAGYPGWNNFLETLVDRCIEENRLSGDDAASYKALVGEAGKHLTLASALKDKLGDVWDQIIAEMFYDNPKEPADVHELLPKLDKLSMIITTNYDTLLEDTYTKALGRRPSVLTFNDGGEMRRLMLQRKFFILKAHGDAAKPGNGIILTTSDYRKLSRERAYQSLLASIFTLHTVFFVGVSLSDPELIVLLDYLADTFAPGSGPVHYALIAQEEVNAVERERWLKDYMIQIIPISSDNNFAEVPGAVEALLKRSAADDVAAG
ncbi:MAG: SIR2 family protein [Rhizobiaceae bacterium]|nr:SIR2 family protein [Rhizobiaceae bacterium]